MAVQLNADLSDEDLQFMNQVGVRYAAVTIHRKDDNVDSYKRYLQNCGEAGVRYVTLGNGIRHTDRETTRGNASARG